MDLLDDIMGYALDEEQRKVVLGEEKYILVVAGAGSGKSLTIIGKIRYLLEEKKVDSSSILCISFTNASTKSLKDKLQKYYGYEIEVYTFHKLALEMIKENTDIPVAIAPSDLLEYTIQEYFYGILFENDQAMKRVLKYFKVPTFQGKIEATYEKFLKQESREFLKFQKQLGKFLRLFKSQAFELSTFYQFSHQNRKKNWFSKRKKTDLFFMIAWDIYLWYEEELQSSNQMDFEDMIKNATKIASQKGSKPYQYIIIDEYQDTSYVRFCLIREILKKTDASLLVVGDDFQSIYQFAGSNLSMFLDFDKQFPNVATYKITNTYRNSQELIDIAGKFIMKNPRQIKKKLKSSKSIKDPIEFIYTAYPKKTLERLLKELTKRGSVLILGRNNQDIRPFLDSKLQLDGTGKITYQSLPTASIQYLTIHKSKGLESDNVILIHVVEDLLGIPSQMEDDPIMKYVLEKQEYYPFEEERRLFYVALTRTKNKVFILSNKKAESRFLKELRHDSKIITYNEL